jgi:hypothetical protein
VVTRGDGAEAAVTRFVYVILPPPAFTASEVDFSFSSSDLFATTESPFRFITDKSQAPDGAPVIEWSEAVRRFIKQWD